MPKNTSEEKYAIKSVVLGDVIIKPWYNSLYRDDLVGKGIVDVLYVCCRCFRYTIDKKKYLGHIKHDEDLEVPGTMIYSKDGYAIMEVDGGTNWMFTTNISLFAKLFIDNKSVCFDVDSFLYYLLVDMTAPVDQPRIVGFFSKEKLSWDNNNLACIVVFPPWQRKGLGQVLMGASYEIGKRHGQIGGPEKPLSAPGERGYNHYWSCAIARFILSYDMKGVPLSVRQISEATYMRPEEIISTLKRMGILGNVRKNGSIGIQKRAIREWIDKNGVNITAPVDPDAFIEPAEGSGSEEAIATEEAAEIDEPEEASAVKGKMLKKRKRGKK